MNFFRGWEAYRDGFGKLTGEHWLGETPADAWPALSCAMHAVRHEPPPHKDASQVSMASSRPGQLPGSA